MCLTIVAYKQHPLYPLVILSNRDEYYHRPTQSAEFWQDYPSVYAGRDLTSLGTWLGVTRTGKIGILTNYRSADAPTLGAPSRGILVKDYLTSTVEPLDYLNGLQSSANIYQGFNLIIGNIAKLYYSSNRYSEITQLPFGVHGLSNHLLNTPWPKVELAKSLVLSYLTNHEHIMIEDLFKILANTDIPADELLPNTGLEQGLERVLASIFVTVNTADYGTRTSTVITINKENELNYYERTFVAEQQACYLKRETYFIIAS
jgi:uncharacterized protein with NRDE domain